MLRIKPGLLKHQIRKTLPVTAVASLVAFMFLSSYGKVLTSHIASPLLFVACHCTALTLMLGRNAKGELAYLYTRGISRDRIWGHTMLACAGSILTVWCLAAVIVWTPIRRMAQPYNPLFPIMAPLEHSIPWIWLLYYAVGLPVMRYASDRWAQPTRGRAGVAMLAVGVLIVTMNLFSAHNIPQWLNGMTIIIAIAVSAVCLLGSWQLHRRLEVRA